MKLISGILIRLIVTPVISKSGQCQTIQGSCDKWSPCCNTSGWCGASYPFCGAGCFEGGNFNSTKCLPKPSCHSGPISISSDRVASSQGFNGDFMNKYFTVDGDYDITDNIITLKLSKPNTGTTLYSTRYINYGRITADLQMDRVGGLVSSLITMADNHDEIDFEWVGEKVTEFQSNWYYQGNIPAYENSDGQIYNQPDSTTWHTYELDWKPDAISWFVNGELLRTQKRSSEKFPSTPSRFSFSIWDAGSGSEGTRQWSGGPINFDQMKDFFGLKIRNIKVQCYGDSTSQDTDFEMDPKLGLVLKDTPPRVPTDEENSKGPVDQGDGEEQNLPLMPDRKNGNNHVNTIRIISSSDSTYLYPSLITFLPLIILFI